MVGLTVSLKVPSGEWQRSSIRGKNNFSTYSNFLKKRLRVRSTGNGWGSFHDPIYTASWPTGEFGGMGLEGAVKLGFRKELETETDQEKEDLYNKLVERSYEK